LKIHSLCLAEREGVAISRSGNLLKNNNLHRKPHVVNTLASCVEWPACTRR